MSGIEYLLLPYPENIQSGMGIVIQNKMIVGSIKSVIHDSQGDFYILFSDNNCPTLDLFSSIYKISSSEITDVFDDDFIVVVDDFDTRIVEIRLGILRSIGLVDSLNNKINKERLSYQAPVITSIDSIDGYDDNLPGAGVLRPKKPNPNLPPAMILVDNDDYRL
jgi:hypothetical protein